MQFIAVRGDKTIRRNELRQDAVNWSLPGVTAGDKMQPIEERLELVRFKVDKTPHIRLNREKCMGCDTTACVYVCPAGLFELLGDEMHFSYEHCLECGTCYVACDRKAIEWEYPRGGWGVSFRAS